MMTRLAVAVLTIFVCVSNALAWNSLGHKVVAEIAWRQLTPEQRQSIVDTLRRHPRFDTDFAAKMEDDVLKGDKALQDHWIFQHAATWPDVIRGDKDHDRPEWHYIDIPQFLDESDRTAFAGKLPVNISTDYPSNTLREHYNVVQAIELCRATLGGKAGPEAKAMAYCWLFHLVGDIHQPLHCTALFSVSHFPKGDRGGNEIPLKRGKNLHSLWDNLLGREYYMRNVEKAVAELSDRNRFGDVWNSAAKETDPRKWAVESHALCESFLYSDAILQAARAMPSGAKLSPIDLPEAYYTTAGERARERVIAAGMRLGLMLGGSAKYQATMPSMPLPVNSLAPIRQPQRPQLRQTIESTSAGLTHWLSKAGVRHNSSCRYYKKSNGQPCTAGDGKPCKVCGG